MQSESPKRGKNVPLSQKGTVPVRWVPARERWLLTTQVNGKKRRAFFKSESEAVRAWCRHCAVVERYGREAARYDARAHREYEEAKRLAQGADLREVAREWLVLRPKVCFVTVAEAVRQYQSAKGALHLSASHLQTVRSHLDGFVRVFGSRFLGGGVSSKDVLAWLLGSGAPKTIENKRTTLVSFFSWCERQEGWGKSPMGGVVASDLPEVPRGRKGFLSVDECVSFMGFMGSVFPEFAASAALRLFAGIRASEVGRLRWEWLDVRAQVVNLPGWDVDADRVTKTGDNWSLRGLPGNLWPWLVRFREVGDRDGFVRSPNSTKWHDIYAAWGESIGRVPPWPSNALRHTFCVMLVSLHGDAGRVATWSRHSSPGELYASYVTQLVSVEEARRFCGILPLPD